MSKVSTEILLIAVIFIAGLTFCFTINILSGIGFIILANIALPGLIKLSHYQSLKQSSHTM